MSLFKTEEFWSIKCGQNETFTTSALCVGNFFSSSNANDQIITGSLNGYLRMFSSSQNIKETKSVTGDNSNPFSIDKSNSLEMKIECCLKNPILQIGSGKFCSESKKDLAVLNPNRLIIFSIDEDNMSFRIMEEFNLKRVGYNFCFGNFGGVSNRDYICVQSTDTTLSFYVNGHLSFSCFLSDYLLPGPIKYHSAEDSFIIVNSNRFLESYKYKNLAVLNNEPSSSKSQKRAVADWNFNLGEDPLEITFCDSPKFGSLILILCRFSFFILNVSSRSAVKKRFELRCKLLAANGIAAVNGQPRFIICNSQDELMVFENTQLKWKAAAVESCLVDLQIGSFGGLDGFIVTLTESGTLSILYLGTEPSTDVVWTSVMRDTLVDNNEKELFELQRKIHAIQSENPTQPIISLGSQSASNQLSISVDQSSAALSSPHDSPTVYRVDIRLKPVRSALRNVLLRVSTPSPIWARQTRFHFALLAPDKSVTCHLEFETRSATVAWSLRASLLASFEPADESLGAPGTAEISLPLPLSLLVISAAPAKQAQFKLTVAEASGSPLVGLSRLFPELAGAATGGASDLADIAVAFQYIHEGPRVTILGSATSGRYRVQSDHFEALWLAVEQLGDRLARHHGDNSRKQTPILKLSDPIGQPLDAFFLVLDYHFSVRAGLTQLHQAVEERARQFRAVERLLLQRVASVAAPSTRDSLHNLESLLDNSIEQLQHLAELISDHEAHLVVAGNALRASLSLIGYLLAGLALPSSSTTAAAIQFAISGQARDFPDFGLEEVYEQNLAYLLRSLGVSGKQRTDKEPGRLTVTSMELPANTERLKKHFRVLADRLAKGSAFGDDAKQLNTPSEKPADDFNVESFVTSPRSVAPGQPPRKTKRSKKPKRVLDDIIDD